MWRGFLLRRDAFADTRELEVMQELNAQKVVGVSYYGGEEKLDRTVEHQAARTLSPAMKMATRPKQIVQYLVTPN